MWILAVSLATGGNVNSTAKYIGRDKESGRRVAVVEIDDYGNIMTPTATVSRGSQPPASGQQHITTTYVLIGRGRGLHTDFSHNSSALHHCNLRLRRS